MTLNDRQQRFVQEYMVDYNATRAAVAAGYSEKTARSIASENLTKPDIVDAINTRKAELEEEYKLRIMGRFEVLARITEIANGDIGDLLPVDEDGKPYGELDAGVLRNAKAQGKSKLIKSVRVKRTPVLLPDGNMEESIETHVEMYSRHEALRDLGKHHALFTDKTEISIKPDEIAKLSDEELAKIARGGK